ncbi:MAG TPA: PSD1 and planctomycete cytochrome C domain-containing protein [Terracidiphilus sp.]|jgi:hypothetical protein|nr:PSD1 and planctomycete cytochrome C domain-containing protein [Terracidiphilus sp.]
MTIGCGVKAWQYVSFRFSARDRVVFSRDIRPIFNQNCVACHGGVRQRNDVSFIYRDEALGVGKSGHRTIVPGNPNASELMARLVANDPEDRMPYHAPALSKQQVELIRRWIKQGAQWDDYWAFVPPKPQPLPAVQRANWARQPWDRFILARLEREGLQPSPEADKAALLRRVSFDLTGLPPTTAEEQAFLADASPDAYEKQVDRLLASPRYGERWASMWLDLARYADTKGYEKDDSRPGMWPYRDWVVEAFNRNLPYDQFVIKQLAGDLLPNPTFEDRIATSFHRQTPNNDEGGTDDEEFRLVAVMDRVATTWSVLNGVTMNCVQCHSHPYDPIRHADYYKSLAFFNTQEDSDLDDDSPNLTVPKDKARYAEAAAIQAEEEALIHKIETSDRQMVEKTQWRPMQVQMADANEAPALEKIVPKLNRYLDTVQQDKKLPAKAKAEQLVELRATIQEAETRLAHARVTGPAKTFHIQAGEVFTDAKVPPQSFYELTANTNLPVVTAIRIEVPPVDAEKARHTPENGFIVDKVEAWLVQPSGAREKIDFRCFAQDSETNLRSAIFSNVKLDPKPGKASYNLKEVDVPSSFAALPKVFRTRWIVGVPAQPLRVPLGGRIEVAVEQTQEIDSKPALIQRIRLSVSGDSGWTAHAQNPQRTQGIVRLQDLYKRLAAIPSVQLPVMVEQQPYERRATLEFERGNFLNKIGPDLAPDVAAIFPKLPDGTPRNRLTLAKWFFQPGQPLTARVAVNRYWQELFGTGIVETLENFGSVGEEPSHPELLDYLALHFQNDLHWDMKALLRELVTSATYRQSAATTPQLTAKDPRNRLLARGPQQRLTAEMVRDQALLASGLLNAAMGGPPVMPPQPAGVWNSVYNNEKWTDATGPNRYRRAVYTFVKRTSGYPSFLTFDASDRDTSLPRRIPTNTPLQALVSLNDPVYQEAARALAQRVVKETARIQFGAASTDDILQLRIRYEARLVLSRDLTPSELPVMLAMYKRALGERQARRVDASLTVSENSSGKTAFPSDHDVDALTAVGSVLFNLDAALNR